MGLTDSPLCRRCGAQEVTSAHVLFECEAAETEMVAWVPFPWALIKLEF